MQKEVCRKNLSECKREHQETVLEITVDYNCQIKVK